MGVWLLFCSCEGLRAQSVAGDEATKTTVTEHDADGKKPLDEDTKRSWALVAVVMFAGLVLLCLVLLFFVVRWGGLARRLARQPLPATKRVDELWFLKPAKPSLPTDTGGSEPPPESDGPSAKETSS